MESKAFAWVLISTDSPKIARICRKVGGWVPFLRPDQLAGDEVSSIEPLIHAVAWFLESKPECVPDSVCLLQPTSPFITSTQINDASAAFEKGEFVSLETFCLAREYPEWLFTIDAAGRAVPCDAGKIEMPSREFPVRYRETGALYFVKTGFLMSKRSLYDLSNHGAYVLPYINSLDIDTQEEWDVAAAVAEKLMREEK